jgi:hypothetical protein
MPAPVEQPMNLWLKIKIWAKMLVLGFVVVYLFVFVYQNDESAPVWVWYNREPRVRVITLAFFTFLAGVLFTLLTRTIFVTVRQIKEATQRARQVQMEKDLAEMKEKAAKLQTRPMPEPVKESGPSDVL